MSLTLVKGNGSGRWGLLVLTVPETSGETLPVSVECTRLFLFFPRLDKLGDVDKVLDMRSECL